MSRNGDLESAGDIDEARWRRFLLVSIAFLLYETVFLLVFPSDFDWGVGAWEGPRFGLLLFAAAVGYLLYGIWAGSFVASTIVICLPVVVALALDGAAVSNDQTGEAWPLYVVWIQFSIIFIVAWLVGSFVGYSLRKKKEDLQ